MSVTRSNWDMPHLRSPRSERRWAAKSLTFTITEKGDTKASAPCNEYRFITPEVAEEIATRLLRAAADARKVRDEAKEQIYPDLSDLVTN